ncbi:hypothetical protein EMPS_07431 [Entomortierella parvispora]|uniref:Ndc10 domain-containing protein n=1 Tax=Entomortierella parvispora TaxID=205924 RepID=A0A9P3HEJ3_9FUNG|nr:hypothetical protein EMPS_07431 [Entomortierella parvispora]
MSECQAAGSNQRPHAGQSKSDKSSPSEEPATTQRQLGPAPTLEVEHSSATLPIDLSAVVNRRALKRAGPTDAPDPKKQATSCTGGNNSSRNPQSQHQPQQQQDQSLIIPDQPQENEYHEVQDTPSPSTEDADSSDKHQDSLKTKRTRAQYSSYQKHWRDWCDRKHYKDHLIDTGRFLIYLKELTAKDVFHHPSDPYESVLPARVFRTKENPDGQPASPETMAFYIKAVSDLYTTQQGTSLNYPPLMNKLTRAIVADYKRRNFGEIKDGNVPQPSTDNAFDVNNLKKIMKLEYTRDYRHQNGNKRTNGRVGGRGRLAFALDHYMRIRGSAIAKAELSTIYPHAYLCNKGRIAAVCFSRWMDKDGNETATATAFQGDDWKTFPLLHGRRDSESLTESGLWRVMSEGLDKVEANRKKVSFAERKSGAQHIRLVGGATAEIFQGDELNRERAVTHYMGNIPPDVPYTMAGFPGANENLWLARNQLTPGVELQRMIFPFIEDLFPGVEDWSKWVDNIMLDRDNDYNRPQGSRHNYPDSMIQAMRFFLILAHLRKVIIQDMAVLVSLRDDPACYYDEHYLYRRPKVFQSVQFKKFHQSLENLIANKIATLAESGQEAQTLPNQLTVASSAIPLPALSEDECLIRERDEDLITDIQSQIEESNRLLGQISEGIRTHEGRSGSTLRKVVLQGLAAAVSSVRTWAIEDLQRHQADRPQPHPSQSHSIADLHRDLAGCHLNETIEPTQTGHGSEGSQKRPITIPEVNPPVMEPSQEFVPPENQEHQLPRSKEHSPATVIQEVSFVSTITEQTPAVAVAVADQPAPKPKNGGKMTIEEYQLKQLEKEQQVGKRGQLQEEIILTMGYH